MEKLSILWGFGVEISSGLWIIIENIPKSFLYRSESNVDNKELLL